MTKHLSLKTNSTACNKYMKPVNMQLCPSQGDICIYFDHHWNLSSCWEQNHNLKFTELYWEETDQASLFSKMNFLTERLYIQKKILKKRKLNLKRKRLVTLGWVQAVLTMITRMKNKKTKIIKTFSQMITRICRKLVNMELEITQF